MDYTIQEWHNTLYTLYTFLINYETAANRPELVEDENEFALKIEGTKMFVMDKKEHSRLKTLFNDSSLEFYIYSNLSLTHTMLCVKDNEEHIFVFEFHLGELKTLDLSKTYHASVIIPNIIAYMKKKPAMIQKITRIKDKIMIWFSEKEEYRLNILLNQAKFKLFEKTNRYLDFAYKCSNGDHQHNWYERLYGGDGNCYDVYRCNWCEDEVEELSDIDTPSV